MEPKTLTSKVQLISTEGGAAYEIPRDALRLADALETFIGRSVPHQLRLHIPNVYLADIAAVLDKGSLLPDTMSESNKLSILLEQLPELRTRKRYHLLWLIKLADYLGFDLLETLVADIIANQVHNVSKEGKQEYLEAIKHALVGIPRPHMAIARRYYLAYGEALRGTDHLPYGFSIGELRAHNRFDPLYFIVGGEKVLELKNHIINSLEGIDKVPGIETVNILHVIDNRLTHLDSKPLLALSNLKRLVVSNGKIKHVEPDIFDVLPNLWHLDVRKNPLNNETLTFLREAKGCYPTKTILISPEDDEEDDDYDE